MIITIVCFVIVVSWMLVERSHNKHLERLVTKQREQIQIQRSIIFEMKRIQKAQDGTIAHLEQAATGRPVVIQVNSADMCQN